MNADSTCYTLFVLLSVVRCGRMLTKQFLLATNVRELHTAPGSEFCGASEMESRNCFLISLGGRTLESGFVACPCFEVWLKTVTTRGKVFGAGDNCTKTTIGSKVGNFDTNRPGGTVEEDGRTCKHG